MSLPKLSELFPNSLKNKEELSAAIFALFEQKIKKEIRSINQKPTLSPQSIVEVTKKELTHILDLNRAEWGVWNEETVNGIIPGLVRACRWVLCLSLWTPQEAVSEGAFMSNATRFYLDRYRTDTPQNRRKKLSVYLSDADKAAIVERTLRALVPSLKAKPRETFFQLTPDYQITFQEGLISAFLYEQTAFYVYLCLNPEEAGFLEQMRRSVQRYVVRKLKESSVPEYEQAAQDIVQDVMELFLKKRIDFVKKRSDFYIDKRIEWFVIDLIRSHKLITAYFRKNNRLDYIDEEFERKLIDPESEEEEALNEKETIRRIVRSCLEKIGERCKTFLQTHYWTDFTQPLAYQEMVDEVNIPLRTLERWMPQCKEKLRVCLLGNFGNQGLRF